MPPPVRLRNLSERDALIALAAIVVFHFAHNAVWLWSELSFPLPHIHAFAYSSMTKLHGHLSEGRLFTLATSLFHNDNAYLYGMTGAFFGLFGRTQQTVVLFNNLVYFSLALFFLYKLGSLLADRRAGLLAAALFSLYPSVYGLSRSFCEEFGAVGMSILALWCLWRSDLFRDRRFSILSGAAFGAGMLVKYSFLLPVLGPLLVTAFLAAKSLARAPARRRNPWALNLLLAAGSAAALLSLKYANPENIWRYLKRPTWEPSAHPWNDPANLKVTLFGPIENHLSFFFFLLWVVAAVAFYRTASARTKWALTLSIMVPWVSNIFMDHHREPHYLFFLVPGIALMTALGLNRLLGSGLKSAAAALLIVLCGLAQFYDFSFGPFLGLDRLKWARFHGADLRNFVFNDLVCGPRRKLGPAFRSTADAIRRHAGPGTIVVSGDGLVLNANTWFCLLWVYDLHVRRLLTQYYEFDLFALRPFQQARVVMFSTSRNDPDLSAWFENAVKRRRAIFADHPGINPSFSTEDFDRFVVENQASLRRQFDETLSRFRLVETIPLYSGEEVQVFVRQP